MVNLQYIRSIRYNVPMNNKKITVSTIKQFSKSAKLNQQLSDVELKGFYAKKLKKGIYFYLYYVSSVGKRRTLSIGHYPTITPEQARIRVKEYLGRIATGEDVRETIDSTLKASKTAELLTVKSYLDNEYEASLNRQESGAQTKQMIINHFSSWFRTPINSITKKDAAKWQKKMENKKLAPATIKRVFGAIKTMFNHAVTNEHIEAHQLENYKLEESQSIESEANEDVLRSYLSKEKVTAFFNALDLYQDEIRRQRENSRTHGRGYLPDLSGVTYVDHVKPWLLFMFYTGFRPGDIFELRWEHINFEHSTIRKVIKKIKHQHKDPMTFPISKQLYSVLLDWNQQLGNPKFGFVFINPKTNKKFGKKALQNPWKKIRAFAGLPEKLQLYTLRHNFASHLIMQGADLVSVSKLMSHKNIQTTIKYYAHLQPDHTQAFVDQFADVFSPVE